jgi:uncharacterized integral membrane protein
MAQSQEHDPVKAERTRTSSTMAGITVAVIFLVLLIVFIAQNNHKVPVHFLWLDGAVSESIALVVSAVAGAVLVLAIGLARIVQLRLAGRRHNRAMKKQDKAAKDGSAPAAPQGEAQSVEPKN